MTPRLHPPEARLLDHAAGGADPAAQALVECHLAMCDVCAARVAELSAPGGAFLALQAPVAPPPGLFGRILEQIGPEAPAAALPFTPALAPYLPADLDRGWRGILARGFRFLELAAELPEGVHLYLVHMAAGRPFPVHRHGGPEEALVLAGGFVDGGERREAGDWTVMAPETRHAPRALEDEDCWLVVRTEAGIRFDGWRGWLQSLGA